MKTIREAVSECGLFVVIGSSGTVYPAAGLASAARENGTETLSINLEPPTNAGLFARAMVGPATIIVPRWVDRVLATAG
jgi:NAD-dependent deacetylase